MEKFFESKTFELSFAEYIYIYRALKVYFTIRSIDGTYFSSWSSAVMDDLISKFGVDFNED